MKTLFVCFLIKMVGILCYAQEINYSNSDVLKLNIMNNATDKNISSKIPEVIAKYIITRKNNTPLTENSRTPIIWENLLGSNRNFKEVTSTNKVEDLNIIKSMPYKYIEVIHYVPIKVTTTGGSKKVILDANSSSDNMRKVLVSNDNLSDIHNIIVNKDRNMVNNDVFKVQKTVINTDNVNKINNMLLNKNDLNNAQKVTVSNNNLRNLQNVIIYKDGLDNMEEHKLNENNMPTIVEENENINIVANKDDLNKVQRISMNVESLNNLKKMLENQYNITSSQKVIVNKNNLNNLNTNRVNQDEDIEKIIVHNENLSNLQKVIVSKDDPDKEQNVFIYNDFDNLVNMPKFEINKGGYNKIQETTASKDVLNNTEKLTEETNKQNGDEIENINKEALLSSLGYLTRHLLKSDDPNKKIRFKLILDNFIKYLENRGLSSWDILDYLRRQREDTNTRLEVLSKGNTNNNENDDNDYIKVIHFNDNMHNNLKQEDIMRAIEKEILLNNFDNPTKEEDAFKIEELYILVLRDFVKYLKQKGNVDSEILEYLQQTQNTATRERVKEAPRQPIDNNHLTSLNTNDEIMTTKIINQNTSSILLKEAMVNLSQENSQNRDDLSNDSTTSIENLVSSSPVQETKGKLNFIQTQETFKKVADTIKPEEENIEVNPQYKTLKENVKFAPIENIVKNLDDKIIINDDKNIESQTLPNILTDSSDEIQVTTTNLPIINNDGTNNDDDKLDLSVEAGKQEVEKGKIESIQLATEKEDNYININDEIVKQNKTNTITPLRSFSNINIPNDKLAIHNQTANNENIPLEVGVTSNDNPEYYETLIVPFTTENILNIPTEIASENGDVYIVKDNNDFIDLRTSEKPNLTSIFDIKSPKSKESDNEDKLSKDKGFYIRRNNNVFVDLWTSEKPNLTSILDVKLPKVNSFDLSTDNKNKLSSNDDTNLRGNYDFIESWTSEKPNSTSIFDIVTPKLEKNDINNNDKELKTEEPNYNTNHIKKIDYPTNIIANELSKLREALSNLIAILQLMYEELNLKKVLLNDNIMNKIRNPQANIKTNLNLVTNDYVVEIVKFLNTILPFLTHTNCNHDDSVYNDLDIQTDDINKLFVTNDNLKGKLLLLVNLLQLKSISQEQILRIIEMSLLNTISPVTEHNTARTYGNVNFFLNHLNHNLQLALYKSLLAIVH